MSELPPLEHTDDPFALLGVAPDVDERELKRAYARKIKVYRPEKAPEEFALIHAAFEHVRMVQELKRSGAPSARETASPAETPSGAATATATASTSANPGAEHLRVLAEAVAREDQAAADAAWKAIVATGGSLEELVVDAPAPVQSWIFDHVTLTWRELSRWRDPQAAFNVWMTTFARRARAREQLGTAIAMASEPTLLTDAAQEPMPAVLALNAVSCLAWRDQDEAERILRKLRSLPSHPVVVGLHDRATLDVDQGGREYKIYGKPPLPAHVLELMADWPILSPPARGQLADQLRGALVANPVEYLEHLDGTVKRYPHLADALTHRLLDGVPAHRRDVASLPDELRDKLGDELRAASRRAPWFLTTLVILLGIVTVVGVALILSPDTEEEGENTVVACSFVLGLYVLAAMGLDRFLYRTKVRKLLVVAVARAGVTRAAAREWLQENRRRVVRLFRFAPWMQGDDALRLVGMIAGNVADDRELAGDDDDAS
jgi:hypothetical protein